MSQQLIRQRLLEAIQVNRQEVQAATVLLQGAQARLDALMEELVLTFTDGQPAEPSEQVESILERAFGDKAPLTFGDEPQV